MGAADRPRRPPIAGVGADLAGWPAPRARRRGPARVGAHECPARAGAAGLRPPGRDPSDLVGHQATATATALALRGRGGPATGCRSGARPLRPAGRPCAAQAARPGRAQRPGADQRAGGRRPGRHGHHRLRRPDPHRPGLRPGGRSGRRAQRARGRARAGERGGRRLSLGHPARAGGARTRRRPDGRPVRRERPHHRLAHPRAGVGAGDRRRGLRPARDDAGRRAGRPGDPVHDDAAPGRPAHGDVDRRPGALVRRPGAELRPAAAPRQG